jgi:XTP/dITP diphosphohydrolase
VAFRDEDTTITFKGEVKGWISREEKGNAGFGFDPIFIPKEGDGRTFAEMSTEEKARISHRARAFRKLAEWITKQNNN